jgi:hypothetical protein
MFSATADDRTTQAHRNGAILYRINMKCLQQCEHPHRSIFNSRQCGGVEQKY